MNDWAEEWDWVSGLPETLILSLLLMSNNNVFIFIVIISLLLVPFLRQGKSDSEWLNSSEGLHSSKMVKMEISP